MIGFLTLCLKITPKDSPASLEDLLTYIYRLQDFFYLLCHQEVLINSLYGCTPRNEHLIQIFRLYNRPDKMRKLPIGFVIQSFLILPLPIIRH